MKAQASAFEAREAHSAQSDRIRTPEAEVAQLKNWDAEKDDCELKPIGFGSVASMLKPPKRATQPPYWFCPTVS
jgi:hypothetical protein